MKVVYECDRKACENCNDYCNHTSNIMHAVNFEQVDKDLFAEKVYAHAELEATEETED